MSTSRGLSFSELCASVRRGPHTVRALQQGLGLPFVPSRTGYSREYQAFLDRVVFLRVFGVPLDDIVSLFGIEKKLLQLLRVDDPAVPLWYLAWSGREDASPHQLLLTRFDVAPYIGEDGAIQMGLDFGVREGELFASAEMGEDIRHVFSLYRSQLGAMGKRLRDESGVVRDALAWVSSDALRKTP